MRAASAEYSFPASVKASSPLPVSARLTRSWGTTGRRELAVASGLALPIEPDPLARERYLLYACVSRATERVTFSYRSSDEDGNVVMPSVFLSDVTELFAPDWRERRRRRLLSDVVWPYDQAPTERERALAAAAANPRSEDPEAATLTLGAEALAHVRHSHVVSAERLKPSLPARSSG